MIPCARAKSCSSAHGYRTIISCARPSLSVGPHRPVVQDRPSSAQTRSRPRPALPGRMLNTKKRTRSCAERLRLESLLVLGNHCRPFTLRLSPSRARSRPEGEALDAAVPRSRPGRKKKRITDSTLALGRRARPRPRSLHARGIPFRSVRRLPTATVPSARTGRRRTTQAPAPGPLHPWSRPSTRSFRHPPLSDTL